MIGMFDATCTKCRRRFGWHGSITDKPPCPQCGHTTPREQLERDAATLATMRRAIDGDPEAETMPFGKYAGKTLGEIAAIDVLYLDWLVDKIKHPDLLKAVGEVCRKYAHEIDSVLAGHND